MRVRPAACASASFGAGERHGDAGPGSRYGGERPFVCYVFGSMHGRADNGERSHGELLALAFRSLQREHGFVPLTIEGRLPEDLSGTLYFVGPARLECQGQPYVHWFDGDGAITAVRLDGGHAVGAVRMIEGPELREERAAGRPLFTSGATPSPSFWRRLGGRTKNTANVNTIACDGRLLSLGDAYRPIEIARDDLRALGETDLGGVVPSSLGAHYRTVATTGRRLGMAIEYGRRTILRILELPEHSVPRELTRLRLASGTVMLHDLAVTQRHVLLFIAPLRVSPLHIILGLRAPLEVVQWSPAEGSEVVVIPLDRPHRPIRFRTPAFFHFHFVGAFDDGDDIVADLVWYPDFSIFEHLRLDRRFSADARARPHGVVKRARVRPGAERVDFETMAPNPAEFPRTAACTAGQRHRHAWISGARDLDELPTVCRLDCDEGSLHPVPMGPRRIAGEGIPIARGEGELETWVATMVYDIDGDRSHVAIIDGAAPEAGPVARLWFDQRIPPPLHGNWHRAG
jgi:all-trans-8'-apo-beta-carotenal 15,15'-oxygenase